MKCINNSYLIEGHVTPHVVQGKAKPDLLSFKEELVIQYTNSTYGLVLENSLKFFFTKFLTSDLD